MPATLTTPEHVRPLKTGKIPAVEIFSTGQHREGDREWTVADLDAMVRNFDANRGTVDPPVVVGHEEDQPLTQPGVPARSGSPGMENTGSPAMGWISRVYRVGPKLLADVIGVPAKFADLINARLYRKVSAEVYDEPPPGAKGSGPMLRRVAFLGGELPQIKSLADLPLVRMADGTPYHTVYQEAAPMDRAALEEQLKGLGWSDAMIEACAGLSDEEFAALANAALAQAAGAAAPAEASPAQEMPPREQMIADLIALGEDEAALQAMTDEELFALWQEKKGAPMSEQHQAGNGAAGAERPAVAPTPAPSAVPAPSPAQLPAAVAAQYAELERRGRELDRQLAHRLGVEKRQQIDSFCEEMVREGVLLPAHVEPGHGWARLQLEAAGAVRRYADRPSDLEALMARIRKGPKVRGPGERVKAGAVAGAASKYAEIFKQAAAERAARKGAEGPSLEERLGMRPRRN